MMRLARISAYLFLFVCVMPGVVFAARKKGTVRQELLKKEKKLEDVKKKIREEKKTIEDISEKETDILGELDRINKGLSVKREELKRAEASFVKARASADEASNSVKGLEAERARLQERLKGRLKAMYKMHSGEAMNALFSSASGEELGRRQKYLTVMMDYDRSLIERSEANLRSLSAERERLEALYDEMRAAKDAASVRKGEAESLQSQRRRMLAGIKTEKEKRVRTVKELEQAASSLSELLGKLKTEEASQERGGGFASMKGRLEMPVEGNVVSSYGRVRHPKFKTVTFNNGIVIEAPAGRAVRSVYGGKVAYAGWLKGYGQLMIIDHGRGFYTLFAHLQKILKDKGDSVEKGMEIALVGDTGVEASTGLYFEVREKGVPRDPMAWIASGR